MKYLVDANVLSEPTKTIPNVAVVEWLRKNEREIAIDPIIPGEIQKVHCLPWEPEAGLQWGALLARLRKSGRSMPIKDSLIAATAIVHDLVVATHNFTDFKYAGVDIVDPFGHQETRRQ